MALNRNRRRALDIWPGFVDGLAALLMVLVFVLMVFALGQFLLGGALRDRDDALGRLSAEVAELGRLLGLERSRSATFEREAGELRASLRDSEAARLAAQTDLEATREQLDAERERAAELAASIATLQALKAELEREAADRLRELEQTRGALVERTELSDRALAQVEALNRQLAALRAQLDELSSALALARSQLDERELRIEELGRELNLALAQRVRELNRYRSEFFGRLRAVLGDRDDIQIVGDRFVLPSEVLFDVGSDTLGEEGLLQMSRLAETLRQLLREIPEDLPWVLQVEGHTDRRPIATARFPSNWELSTARAVAIVRFLRARGIPPERLAATGFGEFHPLDPGDSEEAFARNRRIELKLTSR